MLRFDSRTGFMSYMPLMHSPPLIDVVGHAEVLLPIRDQRDAAQMPAGRMTADVERFGSPPKLLAFL